MTTTTITVPADPNQDDTDHIRHGSFGPIVQTAQGGWRAATQADMDTLPVGRDLTDEEEDEIE